LIGKRQGEGEAARKSTRLSHLPNPAATGARSDTNAKKPDNKQVTMLLTYSQNSFVECMNG
ncbi:hypothetical protein AVEN_231980-2-1, partial [Araneus ventricosus]